MNDVLAQIFQVGFLAAILRIATPLIFATLGEMFSERAGVLNLGIEGIMLISAMTGFSAAYYSGNLWIGIAAAALTGAAFGFLHAVLTVALGLSQHVAGIGLTLFTSGLAYFLFRLIFGQQTNPPSIVGFVPVPIPLLSKIPVVGPILFNQFALVYIAILAVPLAAFVLYRTPWGLALRMAGENPEAARYGGIAVGKVIVVTALISGGLAGLAGVGEVGGVHYQVMSDLSPGFGYSGIVIAMLARLNPLGVVPAAIFLAIVMTGAEAMSRATGVPVFLADVLQGTALIAMLVALLFTSYRIRRVGAAA